MTVIRGRCKACFHSRFFKQLNNDALFCTRNPPQALLLPTSNGPMLSGVWPPVSETDVCGEYTPPAPLLGTAGNFQNLRGDSRDA